MQGRLYTSSEVKNAVEVSSGVALTAVETAVKMMDASTNNEHSELGECIKSLVDQIIKDNSNTILTILKIKE